MREFFKEKWPELFIIVIVLGGFTSLWWQNWAFNERISRQKARTDNIIAALPDLRTRSAYESIYSNFRSAILLSKAREESGKWGMRIRVLDGIKGKASVYKVHVQNPDDLNFNWSLNAIVMQVDAKAINFKDMKSMGITLHYEKFPPDYLVLDSSFVMHVDASQIEGRLRILGAKRVGISTAPKIRTWPMLMDALESSRIPE